MRPCWHQHFVYYMKMNDYKWSFLQLYVLHHSHEFYSKLTWNALTPVMVRNVICVFTERRFPLILHKLSFSSSTCDDSHLTTCASPMLLCRFKGALKHDLPPAERRTLEVGEHPWTAWQERSEKYRVKHRSKTEAANSFHTTAGGNLTEVNICQSSIYLNSVRSKGSLVRQLIFVELCGATVIQKLTYVLLWWWTITEEGEEGMRKEKKKIFSQLCSTSGNPITLK